MLPTNEWTISSITRKRKSVFVGKFSFTSGFFRILCVINLVFCVCLYCWFSLCLLQFSHHTLMSPVFSLAPGQSIPLTSNQRSFENMYNLVPSLLKSIGFSIFPCMNCVDRHLTFGVSCVHLVSGQSVSEWTLLATRFMSYLGPPLCVVFPLAGRLCSQFNPHYPVDFKVDPKPLLTQHPLRVLICLVFALFS